MNTTSGKSTTTNQISNETLTTRQRLYLNHITHNATEVIATRGLEAKCNTQFKFYQAMTKTNGTIPKIISLRHRFQNILDSLSKQATQINLNLSQGRDINLPLGRYVQSVAYSDKHGVHSCIRRLIDDGEDPLFINIESPLICDFLACSTQRPLGERVGICCELIRISTESVRLFGCGDRLLCASAGLMRVLQAPYGNADSDEGGDGGDVDMHATSLGEELP